MRPASSNFIPAPPFGQGVFNRKPCSANGTDGSMGRTLVRAESRKKKLSAIADGTLKLDVGDNSSGPLIRSAKVA